jgi:LemA protein
MEIGTIVLISVGIAGVGALFILGKGWIEIYNKFVYWKTRLDRKFADIDVIMQRRIDMLPALAQVAKKYSIHEYKTIKDTIEARSRWTKDKNASTNQKVEAVQDIENNFLKIQAVFEKYPGVKADSLYKSVMGSGNITRIERKLQEVRLGYNRIAQKYNERVKRFPRNIVAMLHGFKIADYLTLGNKINKDSSEDFNPQELFED